MAVQSQETRKKKFRTELAEGFYRFLRGRDDFIRYAPNYLGTDGICLPFQLEGGVTSVQCSYSPRDFNVWLQSNSPSLDNKSQEELGRKFVEAEALEEIEEPKSRTGLKRILESVIVGEKQEEKGVLPIEEEVKVSIGDTEFLKFSIEEGSTNLHIKRRISYSGDAYSSHKAGAVYNVSWRLVLKPLIKFIHTED